MIRGKGFVDALKLMFDAASPKKMWTHKHNDGRLSIFALANSFAKALAGIPNSESLAIVCDIVLPAWDGADTDKPMTLLNHASFYMKGCDFISLKKVVVHCGGPHATERSLAMMAQTQAALCSRQCMPACLHRRATMILAAASACADEM